MERQLISTGTEAEDFAGFSQAVRVGDAVFVSGSNAMDDQGRIQHPEDAGEQARETLRKIADALQRAGATLDDVVRTRVFLRRTEDAETVARVHREVFADIRPANSFVRAEPIGADMLVEIEADALVTGRVAADRG